jgi:tetratricopeptide (TPR) repeat protein
LPHTNLGTVLFEKGQWDEAAREHREALALDPKLAQAHLGISQVRLAKGQALLAKGQMDEMVEELRAALTEFRAAVDLDPKFAQASSNQYAQAHLGLGAAFAAKAMSRVIAAQPDEAVKELRAALAEFRAASALDPKVAEGFSGKLAEVHVYLGAALRDLGRPDEAIESFRQAIELDPKHVAAHNGLGLALHSLGQFHEAIRAYRKALELDPNNSRAHNNIGWSLQNMGQFNEADREYRTAVELDPGNTTARNNLRNTERLVELDRKLPAVLEAKVKPADDAERLALARLCLEPFKGFYAASARLYAEAFANDAKLADDMQQLHRYNAACAAARAGTGQGKDAGQLEDKERARLRQQALEWLRADLAWWAGRADGADARARETIRRQMKHWQTDADLAGLRDQDALEKLSAEEREAWQKLWADVAALLKRMEDKK